MSFAAFGLHRDLLAGVADLGFTAPTPLQQQILPAVAAGQDILAAARSGHGKTVAYLLPVLHQLLETPREGTRVVVVTATRELAARAVEQLQGLARHTPLRCAAIFGGVPPEPQAEAFVNGVEVLVATPARFLEHLEQPYATLPALEVLVLDEVDRIHDMGFLPDLRRLIEKLPPRRQTVMLAGNLTPPVVELAGEILRDPLTLQPELAPEPQQEVQQAVYPVPEDLKRALLLALLERLGSSNVLVFTRTKHRANRLAEWLSRNGVPSERIHGNRSQKQRLDALAGFRNGTYSVLVATDIAARGLELQKLARIVNLDVPNAPEDYLQRVGRAATLATSKEALTFVSELDEGNLKAIERALGLTLPRVTLPGFDYDARPTDTLEGPVEERVAEMRPRPVEERPRPVAKPARRRDNDKRQQPRGPAQPGMPRPVIERAPGDFEDEDEARIRAIAEQQQAAAVAARTQPSRMGMMELRNPNSWQGANRPSGGGGGGGANAGAGAGRRRNRRGRPGR